MEKNNIVSKGDLERISFIAGFTTAMGFYNRKQDAFPLPPFFCKVRKKLFNKYDHDTVQSLIWDRYVTLDVHGEKV